MKRIIIVGLVLAGFITSQAQERLSREESLKAAFFATANLKEMLNTPIPTDPDVKRPVGYKDGDYGAMVFPETKLSDSLAKMGKEVVPVGQLWMLKLAPLNDGQVVPTSKLRMVHVSAGDQEADVVCCALGVRKSSDGAPELLIYGKDKEPVMKVALKSVSGQQENPLDFSADRKDNGGELTLKIAGKYEAVFMVTDPEQY